MSRGLGKLQRKILEVLAATLYDAPNGVGVWWLKSEGVKRSMSAGSSIPRQALR